MDYNYGRPAPQEKEDKSKKVKLAKIICLVVAIVCVVAAAIVAVIWFTGNVSVDGKMVNKKLVVNCNGLTIYLGQEIDPVDVSDEMELPIIESASNADAGLAVVGVEGKFVVYLQKSGREYYVSGWEICEEDISYGGISVGDDIEDVVAMFPEGQSYCQDGSKTAFFYIYFDKNGNAYNTGALWDILNETSRSESALAEIRSEYPSLLVEWNPYDGEVTKIKLTMEIEE